MCMHMYSSVLYILICLYILMHIRLLLLQQKSGTGENSYFELLLNIVTVAVIFSLILV